MWQPPRCKLFLHDVTNQLASNSSGGLELLRTPNDWSELQYSTEDALLRVLQGSPWLVKDPRNADAIFVVTRRSMLCRKALTDQSNKARVRLSIFSDALWRGALTHPTIATVAVPRVVSVQDHVCRPPPGSRTRRHDVIQLVEMVDLTRNPLLLPPRSPGGPGVVHQLPTPFVTPSRPSWLLASNSSVPSAIPWSARKLLFFAGHVPKLINSRVRYFIWRQVPIIS